MKFTTPEIDENIIQFKNLILLLLIIIDLIFIVAISIFNLPDSELTFMAYFDLFVCILLAINLIFEYKNRDCGRWEFIKTHIIDIISIIPVNFILLRYLTVFRLVRILQVLQLVRFIRLKDQNSESFRYVVQNQLLKSLAIILILYMVISSIILYSVDSSFTSIFESFWYGVVTITGVGYGDMTPNTTVGKFIGILTIIIGVLFISVFTAATSAMYMEKPEKETREAMTSILLEIQEENIKLKEEIEEIKKESEKMNEKLDHLTELLEND